MNDDLFFDIGDGDVLNNKPPQRPRQPYRPKGSTGQFKERDTPLQFWYNSLMNLGTSSNQSQRGLVFALLAIILFQFRGTITASLKLMQQSLHESSLIFFVLDLWDYLRSFVCVVLDAVVNFRFLFLSAGGAMADRNNVGGVNGWGRLGMADGRTAYTDGKTRRRRKLYERGGIGVQNMPELVEVPSASPSLTESHSSAVARKERGRREKELASEGKRGEQRTSFSKCSDREIEPAFLREEDYPPGWLVYHPVHGVISKLDADKIRREGEAGIAVCCPTKHRNERHSSSETC